MQHKTTISIQADTPENTIGALEHIIHMMKNVAMWERDAVELMDGTHKVNGATFKAMIEHEQEEQQEEANPLAKYHMHDGLDPLRDKLNGFLEGGAE